MKSAAGKPKNWGAMAILLLLVAVACWHLWQEGQTPAVGEEKSIVVQVIHGDQSTREFPLTTEQEFLGPVLVDSGIVQGEQGAYGLYILAADGEIADASQQQWWCLTKGGAQVATGADSTPVAQGDHFELTLKTGY